MALNSFSTALSGLNASTTSLSVIGNNLANMNTVGYKSSVVQFQDLLARTVLAYNGAGNPFQVGLGVQASAISSNFQQGSLQSTGQPSDVAIVGPGFFVVRDGQASYFTRAGNFALDAQGNLLTQQGQNVRGYPIVNGVPDTNASLVDMRVDPGEVLPATATKLARFVSNLNAAMATGDSFTTAVQVVDSLGASHTVSFKFTRNAPGAPGAGPSFAFDATVDGADVVGGTAGTPFSLLTGANAAAPPGNVTFGSDGKLASVNSGAGAVAPPADFVLNLPALTNGAAAQPITIDLVDAAGNASLTAFAAPSSTSSTFQDGHSAANLLTFSVDPEGVILGVFANGKTAPLGQLAIAQFNNPQGLVRIGGNGFAASANSGEPSVGTPGTGGRGNLSSSTLELSNVDIATEFTSLIIAQRGYQANSRMVTTTDEVLQEAINLKR